MWPRCPAGLSQSDDRDHAYLSHSLEYIQEIAGCRTVPVEVGSRYTDEEWSQTLMTVNEFISKYVRNEVCRRACCPTALTVGSTQDIRALQEGHLEGSVGGPE